MGTQPGYTSRHWSFIERWCVAPDTWALADPISVILLAGFRGEGIIDDQLLRAWIATDEPFWFRRFALVGHHRHKPRRPRRAHQSPATPSRARAGLWRARSRAHPRVPRALHPGQAPLHPPGRALRVLVEIERAGVARFVQTHCADFTRAMLNKARLDDDGRRKP